MTTKFNIGEEVWVMLNNEPTKLKVLSISITSLEEYRLYHDIIDGRCIRESVEMFYTKEELKLYVFGKD